MVVPARAVASMLLFAQTQPVRPHTPALPAPVACHTLHKYGGQAQDQTRFKHNSQQTNELQMGTSQHPTNTSRTQHSVTGVKSDNPCRGPAIFAPTPCCTDRHNACWRPFQDRSQRVRQLANG